MAKDRSTCLKWCMAEQKCIIVVAATLVFLMGFSLSSMAATALNSLQVQQDAEMSNEFSHGAMDLMKLIKSVLAFGLFTMLASILGCCGACRENKCCLFIYSISGICFAAAFLICGVMADSVIEVQAPNLIRASNRICANAAALEANDLKCNNQTMAADLVGMLPPDALTATVAPPTAGTNTATGATSRRLMEFLAGADEAMGVNWFGPGTPGHKAVFVAARMMGQRVEEQAAPGSLPTVFGFVEQEGRRLDAGTTEKQLVAKLGGSNPCGFVTELCAPPEGFNPVTACICKGGKVASKNAYGSFCNDWNSEAVNGQAPGPAGVNWCYVTAGSLCDSSYESVTEMTGDVASSAPCAGSPDFRSAAVKDGIGLVNLVVKMILATGILLLASVISSCCLCCELHTGKNAEEHGRSLVGASDSDSD